MYTNFTKKLLAILIVLFAISSCQKDQNSIDKTDEATTTSEKSLKCGKLPISSILQNLVKENSQVSAMIFGEMDKNGKSSFSTAGAINPSDNIFTASPGSKGMTTYLILKEKINIDQSINKWFPETLGYTKASKITLRMLLNHTSGINDYPGVAPDSISTYQGIVDYIYKGSNLKFAPGTMWCYSNTNFLMAGMILEKITKKTYTQLLKKHFGKIAPSLFIMDSHPFSLASGCTPFPFNPIQPAFAGGLVGSSIDILKAFDHIYKSPEYNKMKQFVTVPSFSTICSDCNCDGYIYADVYGLGTAKYTINGRTIYGADGNIFVCFPQIFTYEGKTFFINTLVNSYPSDALGLKKHHAEVLLGAAID